MPNTPRMTWPYPSADQRPWFDIFERMIQLVDQSAYARIEDSSFMLMGGGTVSWDATTQLLEWSATIELITVQTGAKLQIAAGSITLTEGQIFYVTVPRGTGGTVALTPYKGNVMPVSDDVVMVAIRRGDQVFFRNGRMLDDGESGTIYINSSTLGTISDFIRNQITVATNGDTWFGTGATASAASQGALSGGFDTAVMAPESVDVFFNNGLCHYTVNPPTSVNEWRWITSGSPQPVIQIGSGSLAGDKVTVKYPI